MVKRLGTLSGKSAKRVGIVAAVLTALIVLPAIAWAVSIEIGGEVYSDKCTPCHADFTDTENPTYVFTHGNHITYQCSTCHPEFPHKPGGTDLPMMQECFNCHNLRHGPQGVIATGTCSDCHGNNLPGLRPDFHNVAGWAGEGHVAPANERLTTQCSMCHVKAQCDECHVREQVWWKPPVEMVYDAGSGCLACHGSPNLIKSSAFGIRTLQVSGLDGSAHRDVTCPQCHVDFVYADVESATRVWYINAGLACGSPDCHGTDDPETEANEDHMTAYRTSVHATTIADGDFTSATCGSCHGGHDIRRLDTEAAKRALQVSGSSMCKPCHEDRWENYDDSYHGRAYKAGAGDSPACWDCHSAHEVLPSNDPLSATNDTKLAATCASCHQHKDASESFIEQTAGMIHETYSTRESNPLLKLLRLGKKTSAEDGGS